MATTTTINPVSGERLATYPNTTGAEVDAALSRSATAQEEWRGAGFPARGRALLSLAESLRAHRQEAAALMTAEMGKPLTQAVAEVDKCAWVCEHYAEGGAAMLAAEEIPTEAAESYVQFPPLGLVLAVMPWNYPLWQVLRAVAPALMAGNGVVLKHASNVTGSALLLAELVRSCDLPESILEVLVVPGSEVDGLIADPRVAAVTLTGSELVGVNVAEACARALKPSVLELGGSDAFIVLEDADIEEAARVGVAARFQNTGQSCIAAKRFIIVADVAEEFEERFASAAAALRAGDPSGDVDIGPMARADLRDELADQVAATVSSGGRLLTGGITPSGPGAFYPATVVADVCPGMPLFDQETFGPAAAIVRADDGEDAIRLANLSPYGLSSALWTRDLDRARSLAARIEAGAVFVNSMSASDPRMPFGGVKRSGWGRARQLWHS